MQLFEALSLQLFEAMSCHDSAATEQTWMQEKVEELKFQWNWGLKFAVWMLYQLWIPVVFAAVNGYRVDKGIEDILKDAVLLKALLFMPLQILQQMQRSHHHVKTTAEKSSYIEKRIMKAVEPMGDTTRTVGQDVVEFNADKGEPTWLERRLRDHYESYMKANPCLKSKATAGLVWTFVCTEVMLRNCRDCINDRLYYLKSEDGAQMGYSLGAVLQEHDEELQVEVRVLGAHGAAKVLGGNGGNVRRSST